MRVVTAALQSCRTAGQLPMASSAIHVLPGLGGSILYLLSLPTGMCGRNRRTRTRATRDYCEPSSAPSWAEVSIVSNHRHAGGRMAQTIDPCSSKQRRVACPGREGWARRGPCAQASELQLRISCSSLRGSKGRVQERLESAKLVSKRWDPRPTWRHRLVSLAIGWCDVCTKVHACHVCKKTEA